MVDRTAAFRLSSWRLKGVGVLRILFGMIWAVDAWFKWQPAFADKFAGYLADALQGQPAGVQAWIAFWLNIVQWQPRLFAHLIGLAEAAVALGLIFGVFSNLTDLGGAVLALMIWSTAEGFGGPYGPGTTDVGAAILYAVVFAGLFLANAGLVLGLDAWLTPALGRWGILASGTWHRGEPAGRRPGSGGRDRGLEPVPVRTSD